MNLIKVNQELTHFIVRNEFAKKFFIKWEHQMIKK